MLDSSPTRDQPIETTTEFAAILRELRRRRDAGPDLTVPALRALEHAVRTGSGPAAAGRHAPAGLIDAADADLATDILLANEGPVTRAEADALFDIHAAASRRCPEWDDLLIGAVAQHLAHGAGHAVRSRARSLSAAGGLPRVSIDPPARAWLDARTQGGSDPDIVLRHFAGVDHAEMLGEPEACTQAA